MPSRLWITLLAAIALIVGSVGIASAIPTDSESGAGKATEVLGARLVSPVVHQAPSSTLPSTTTTSTTTTSTTTTTTTSLPSALRPGPLAQPSPSVPVTFTQTTPAIDRVPTTDKVIFLGIDDGLVRDPDVLALLQRERVPLTLFLVRQPALDGQEYFRAMQAAGATIQAHTISHPQMKTLGSSDQTHQVCGDLGELQTWYGARPTLFRPPYGEWNETTRAAVHSCGLRALVLWRGATNDGRLDLIGGPDYHPGDILLMHFRKDLLENLKLVFARARAQGYKIGRLEDYLGSGPPHPMFSAR
ncbi:MAG: polysaccharide deacetylase family protein [Acidimicrobiia bacterium]